MGVIGGCFGWCCGVDFVVDIFDFFGDLLGGVVCCFFEGYVFEKMGNFVFICYFIVWIGFYLYVECYVFEMWYVFGDDC